MTKTINKIDRIIWWSFAAILLGVPLLFIPQVSLMYELPKVALFRTLTLIIAFLLFVKISLDKKIYFPKVKKIFWILLGLFLGIFALATIFSISPYISFWGSYSRLQGLLQFSHYLLFFICVITFFHNKKEELLKLISVACIGALTVAVISLFQTSYYSRVDSTLGHPSALASYLILLIPFFFLKIKETNKNSRIFWIIALGIVFISLILSGSRAAFLGLFVGLIYFSGISRKFKLLIIPAVLVLLLISINLFGNKIGSPTINRFILSEKSFESFEIRKLIWPSALNMIKERPLIGFGPDMISEGIIPHLPNELEEYSKGVKKVDRAHNEILDISGQMGIIGLFAYLGILIFLIKISFENKKSLPILAGSTAIISLFIANMFGFSTTVHYVIWWLIVAMLIVYSSKSKAAEITFSFKKTPRNFLIVALTIIFSIYIYELNVKPLYADYEYKIARDYALEIDHLNITKHVLRAVEINPKEIHYGIFGAEHSFIIAKNHPIFRKAFLKIGEEFLEPVKEKAPKLSKVLELENIARKISNE